MLGAVERRFGNDLPSSPVEWLTDNGSCYRANETRQFARMLGLEPKNPSEHHRCCLSENLLYRHRNGHIQAEWP